MTGFWDGYGKAARYPTRNEKARLSKLFPYQNTEKRRDPFGVISQAMKKSSPGGEDFRLPFDQLFFCLKVAQTVSVQEVA